jgi:hypothetical protein
MSIAAIVALALLCGAEPIEPVKVELRRAADKVAVVQKDDGPVIVNVTSATGIGAATLQRSGDKWPNALTVRVNLRGLEGLTIAHGDTRLRTSLQQADHEGWRRAADGQWQPAELDAAFRPKLTLDKTGVTIEIPAHWLDPKQDELLIEWIDFYRN